MTRIVKYGSVVDEHPDASLLAAVIAEPLKPSGVIKRQALMGQTQQSNLRAPLPTRDQYTDELNRLRVDIKAAKDELRELTAQLEEARDALRNPIARVLDGDGFTAEDAEIEAVEIIEDARKKAMDLLQNAQDESAALLEQSKNNGYLEGYSKGNEEALEEFNREYGSQMVLIAEVLDRLSDYEAEVLGSRERDLTELAFAVAKKIIGRTLDCDPAVVADMLRSVVTENSREDFVKITLSPELVPIQAKASEKVRKLITDLGGNVTLTVGQDAAPGEITVETPKGVVDISIETQLNNLKTAVLSE